MRRFLGILVGVRTGEVKAVINPDRDDDLDDPTWLDLRGGAPEEVRMIKAPRGKHKGPMSAADAAALVAKYQP